MVINMKKLPFILDLLSYFFLFFCLSFTVLKFYDFTSNKNILLISLLISCLGDMVLYVFLKRRRFTKLLINQDAKELLTLDEHLCLLTFKKQTEFINQIYSDYEIKDLQGIFYLEKDKNIILPLYDLSPLKTFNLIYLLDLFENKIVTIFTKEKERNCDIISNKYNNLTFKNNSDLLKIINEKNLKSIIPTKEKIKVDYKTFFAEIITKKRAKKFALCGVFLSFFSFISPFPLYYVLVGSTFIILSIICKFFGKEKKVL